MALGSGLGLYLGLGLGLWLWSIVVPFMDGPMNAAVDASLGPCMGEAMIDHGHGIVQ